MAQLPDVESLQLLVLVGEHGSLTSAAAVAGISQPSASKRMSAFERRLGLTLLDRSRRGSALTPSGVVVCGWAQRVLDQMSVLVDGVAALRREHTPQLSLAASLTVAEHLLPVWLGDLRRIAPELHVGLQVVNSNRVCELVSREGVELGFVESPGGLRGLRSRVVASDRLMLVVAPDHPWARRCSASWSWHRISPRACSPRCRRPRSTSGARCGRCGARGRDPVEGRPTCCSSRPAGVGRAESRPAADEPRRRPLAAPALRSTTAIGHGGDEHDRVRIDRRGAIGLLPGLDQCGARRLHMREGGPPAEESADL